MSALEVLEPTPSLPGAESSPSCEQWVSARSSASPPFPGRPSPSQLSSCPEGPMGSSRDAAWLRRETAELGTLALAHRPGRDACSVRPCFLTCTSLRLLEAPCEAGDGMSGWGISHPLWVPEAWVLGWAWLGGKLGALPMTLRLNPPSQAHRLGPPCTHPDAQDLSAASAHPFWALPRAAPHALLAAHHC